MKKGIYFVYASKKDIEKAIDIMEKLANEEDKKVKTLCEEKDK